MAASALEVDACFVDAQLLASFWVQAHRVEAHRHLLSLGLAHATSMVEDVFLPSSPHASLPEFYIDALDSKSIRLQKNLSSAAEDLKLASLVRSLLSQMFTAWSP